MAAPAPPEPASSAWECLLLCLVGPAGVAARRAAARLLPSTPPALSYGLDAAALALPPLLALLAPAAAPGLVVALLSLAAGLAALRPRGRRSPAPSLAAPAGGALCCVSALRTCLLCGTTAAILAVDFPQLFAPRLAKSGPAGGWGLMDLGAGAFVLAAALVSPEARLAGDAGPQRQRPGRWKQQLASGCGGGAPLLLLAAARLAAVRAAGYAVDAGEYGRDWNFFASLAVVRALAAAAPAPRPRPRPGGGGGGGGGGALAAAARAAAVGAAAQLWLTAGGGRAWVAVPQAARPPGLLSQNREGLAGVPGLWCLHLAGVALGRLLRAAPPPAPAGAEASAAAASFAHARALLPPTALLRAACAGCGALGGWRPPRRACGDAHYTLWVASHCATLLLACALACAVDDGGEGGGGRGGDGSAQQQQPPRSVGLVAALSARGAALATFLAANVLTGAANVGLRAALPGRGPAGVPPAPAAAGLAAYVLAVAAFACWAGRGGG